MSQFDDLVKVAGNEFASKVSEGNDADVTQFIDTGSYTLNALFSGSIYGGVPGNKISAFAGLPATGKTFYALNVVKMFLEANPKGGVVYFESESAVTTDQITSRGIPANRVYICPVVTIQEFRSQCVRIIDKYLEIPEKERQPLFMVLDSLGSLSTTKEVTDIAAGSETKDMTRAGLVRAAFRVLTLKLGRAKVAMIVTNHVYESVGAYVPTKTMGGGQGLPYAASTIVFLSKSKQWEKDESGDAKAVSGAVVTAATNKARLTIENKKVETLLDYRDGLDRYYGLLDLAEKFGIVEKISKKVLFPGHDKPVFQSQVIKNPTKFFTKEILDKIDEGCKKEFMYGSPLEEFNDEEVAEPTEEVEEAK
jgi:RecA/RadA recombinase